MGLFDEPEEEQYVSTDAVDEFDKDSKIRLFETQKRESDEAHGYFKKLIPVAVVAILIIAGVIYFMQPGIGSAIKPPKATEDAVYEYMNSKEHRSVREITFYNCDGFYRVKILAEPRTALASVDDPSNKYRLIVKQNEQGGTDIQPSPQMPMIVNEQDAPNPCTSD